MCDFMREDVSDLVNVRGIWNPNIQASLHVCFKSTECVTDLDQESESTFELNLKLNHYKQVEPS